MRAKFANTLVLALAFGIVEPEPNRFLQRTTTALRRLSTVGAWVRIPGTDIDIFFKAVPIAVIGDCLALSGLYNMTQGYFSCFFCEMRGMHDATVNFTTFPYALKQQQWQMRSDARHQVTLREIEWVRAKTIKTPAERAASQSLCRYKGGSTLLDMCGVQATAVDVRYSSTLPMATTCPPPPNPWKL